MIDARGRSCPEPVIMIKKAMGSREKVYQMIVDNAVSVENVTRYAQHNGYSVDVEQSDEDFILTITQK